VSRKLVLSLLFTLQLIPVAFANPQSGIASVYSTDSGVKTTSGARLDPAAFTAAHRSLPFGSRVRVTNRRNGRTVVATINDRGPFVPGRIIDLTPASARAHVGAGVRDARSRSKGPLGRPAWRHTSHKGI
jgi:rare lipoprotein A